MDLPFLRDFSQALDFKALDPATEQGQRYYVDLHGDGVSEVTEIATEIQLASGFTVQGLTGPSGSGKTTELLRLREDLGNVGYRVVYVDMLRYQPSSLPVRPATFLIGIALGVAEATEDSDHGRSGAIASLWERISRLRVTIDGVSLSAGPVDIDLKAELKGNASFVERLHRELEANQSAFVAEVKQFIAQQLDRDERRAVVLVDQTEKISGTKAVHESLRDLFLHGSDQLRLAGTHVVYSLPPYLPIIATGVLKTFDKPVRQVLSLSLHDHDGKPDHQAREALRSVVAQRGPEWERLVSGEQLDRIIDASGGHLRDLFLLLREVIGATVSRRAEHPVTDAIVDGAIDDVAAQFQQMTAESADLLRAIENDPSYKPAEDDVLRVADLLQTHVLLVHRNGEWWWDVHPLAKPALSP